MTDISEINQIWTAVEVEADGQEQVVRIFNGPLLVCDPVKLLHLRQLAEMTAINHGREIKIVKFVRAEVTEVIEPEVPDASNLFHRGPRGGPQ